MQKGDSLFKGMFFLFLAQIMVGINIVLSKYILASIPIQLILALRFSLAAAILFVLHEVSPARKQSISYYFSQLKRRDWYFILGQALCAGVLFNALMLLGLHYTDANIAGIITSVLPVIIALMSWIILNEKISAKTAVCIGFATLGLLVIAREKLGGPVVSHSFLGDAIVLISLFPEAAYYLLSKMYVSSLPVFLVSSLLNGINAVLLLCFVSFSSWHGIHIDAFGWWILTILGLSSGLFYVFWYFGSQRVDGVMASLSTAIMPLATVVLAWLLLGEKLTMGQIIGMGMVLLSIVIYAKR